MDYKVKKIGDIAYLDLASAEQVENDKLYQMVGVYSYGKGLFDKEAVLGMNTSYKVFYKLKVDHIIMSQLFGWEGAIASCSLDFEGKYVSSQFPVFLVDQKHTIKNYVYYFLNQPIIWKKLFEAGKGMGSRRRTLNPDSLLSLEIPFPPLEEQIRIVNILDGVKQKIDEIKKIRDDQEIELRHLRDTFFYMLQSSCEMAELSILLSPVQEEYKVEPEALYKQIKVKLFHKGILLRQSIRGSEVGSSQLLARKGYFIISKIDARNGAMGIIPEELDNAIVTKDFPLFEFSENILPKYFEIFSDTKYFDDACKLASEGTTNRKRLKMENFFSIKFPLPDVELQNKLIETFDCLHSLLSKKNELLTELEELFPALLAKAFKGEL